MNMGAPRHRAGQPGARAPRSPPGPVAPRAGAGPGSCSASRSSIVAVARVLHEGAAARAVREGGRARRGDRGRATRRRSRWRPRSPGSRRSRRSAPSLVGVLRARLRPLQPARARVALPQRQPARARACSHRGIILSLSGIAALPFLPFVGRYFDRTYRKNPAKALALVGAADPAVGALHAAAVLDAQHRRGSGSSGIPQAVLTASRVRDGRAGAAGRRAVPAARHGHRDGDDVHLLHRRLRRRHRRRASSPNAIGVRGTVIVLGVPDEHHRRRCC